MCHFLNTASTYILSPDEFSGSGDIVYDKDTLIPVDSNQMSTDHFNIAIHNALDNERNKNCYVFNEVLQKELQNDIQADCITWDDYAEAFKRDPSGMCYSPEGQTFLSGS